MIERITPLSDDFHLAAQSLLAWYVTGQLDAADQARVEAHLAVCAQCQADLKAERRLRDAIADQPAEAAPAPELALARLKARIERQGPRLAPSLPRRLPPWRAALPWVGWALAAVQLALWLVAAPLLSTPVPPARYHTLASAAAPVEGNVLIVFRPRTPESDLRAALEAAGGARLTDGPTQAGAYVLRVPAQDRAADLAILRHRPEVVLAEPIDPGGAR